MVIGELTNGKSGKSRLCDCSKDFMPWLPQSSQTVPHRGRSLSRRLKSGFCACTDCSVRTSTYVRSYLHISAFMHTYLRSHIKLRPHVTDFQPCVTVSSLHVTVSYWCSELCPTNALHCWTECISHYCSTTAVSYQFSGTLVNWLHAILYFFARQFHSKLSPQLWHLTPKNFYGLQKLQRWFMQNKLAFLEV